MKITICPASRLPLIIQRQLFSYVLQQWSALHTPELKDDHIAQVVLTEDNSVLGYAEIYTYPTTNERLTTLVYGLRCVWTAPHRRRCGVGQQVVYAATCYMANSPIDLGVLWCRPALKPWYGLNGWKKAGSSLSALIGPEAAEGADGEVAMVLRVSGRHRLGIGCAA